MPGRIAYSGHSPERRMKTSDLAAQCIAAALLTGVALGSITLAGSRPASDDTSRALPPAADLSLALPMNRGDARHGVDDMFYVGDVQVGAGREEAERNAPPRLSEVDPQT
jgi:hypothetical protein